MDFDYSPKVRDRVEQVEAFMQENVYPREREHHDFVMDPQNLWKQPPVVEELKAKAKHEGIWNWFADLADAERLRRASQAMHNANR